MRRNEVMRRPFVPSEYTLELMRKAKERVAALPRKQISSPPPIVQSLPVNVEINKIAVVYIFAGNLGAKHWSNALRFINSYMRNPPGVDHSSVIVLNGAKVTEDIRKLFSVMPDPIFIEHDNSGWDIGGYQRAAREVDCDLMVFIGGTSYIKGPDWLKRMKESYLKHGHGIYGCMGNRGDPKVRVEPHIRTTGFWMHPALMNQFPYIVRRQDQRYEFEHGKSCLTGWVTNIKKLKAWVVTWDGEYLWEQWDAIPNGFHRGNQSGLLIGDRLTDPPFYPY